MVEEEDARLSGEFCSQVCVEVVVELGALL